MKHLVAALLVAAALIGSAARGDADDEVPMESAWGGSNIAPPAPITAPITRLRVEGRIQNGLGGAGAITYVRPGVAVSLDRDLATGCDLEPNGPATGAAMGNASFDNRLPARWKRYAYRADVPFSPSRNGPHPIFVCINGERRLDTEVLVRLPAPRVTNLVATAAGHDVALAWDDMRGAAPDLSGYRVERSLSGGAFSPVQMVGSAGAGFTDTTLPAAGGEATYRVVALRPFVDDAAPSNTSAATFAAAPAGTAGEGSDTGGGASGGTIPGGRTIRVPRVGMPSGSDSPALLGPPADAGFSEDLPFDDPEPGELLRDELALDDTAEGVPNRGLAIPLATALVLAVWALHLRHLARAIRPSRRSTNASAATTSSSAEVGQGQERAEADPRDRDRAPVHLGGRPAHDRRADPHPSSRP